MEGTGGKMCLLISKQKNNHCMVVTNNISSPLIRVAFFVVVQEILVTVPI
jgi:hypothetical protein